MNWHLGRKLKTSRLDLLEKVSQWVVMITVCFDMDKLRGGEESLYLHAFQGAMGVYELNNLAFKPIVPENSLLLKQAAFRCSSAVPQMSLD